MVLFIRAGRGLWMGSVRMRGTDSVVEYDEGANL